VATGVRLECHPDPEPEVLEDLEQEQPQAGASAGTLRAELEAYRRGELVYVRAIAFVDVELDGRRHRWEWTPSRPRPVPLRTRATAAVVDIARGVESRTRGRLLTEARVAGLRLTTWEVESAPRRIELDPALESQLMLD
jgi:hypothetical protein